MTDERADTVREPIGEVPEVPAAASETDITMAADGGPPPAGPSGPAAESGPASPASPASPPGPSSPSSPSSPPGPSGPAAESGPAVEPGGPADAGERSPSDDVGPRDEAPPPPLRRILEAILLVVDEPVPAVDLAQVVEQPRAEIERTLAELAAEYTEAGRGFELRQVAGGWRLYTAADCAPYVERFVLDGQQARLTQAALETLAVIAYRQPVSRQSVAAIRGVNVDGVVRTLVSRGLVAEAGQEGPGGAHLYVTTPYFLERLGLRSLDELPNLAPLLPTNLDDLADQA